MLYDKCIILFLTFKNWTYLTFDNSIKSYCLNKLVTVVFTSNVWNVKPNESQSKANELIWNARKHIEYNRMIPNPSEKAIFNMK